MEGASRQAQHKLTSPPSTSNGCERTGQANARGGGTRCVHHLDISRRQRLLLLFLSKVRGNLTQAGGLRALRVYTAIPASLGTRCSVTSFSPSLAATRVAGTSARKTGVARALGR